MSLSICQSSVCCKISSLFDFQHMDGDSTTKMKFIFLFIFGLFLVSFSSASKPLYRPYDPLVQLNSSNFHSTIIGKSHAWIVEFYSSWCGHCQHFAPTWREFARQIKSICSFYTKKLIRSCICYQIIECKT